MSNREKIKILYDSQLFQLQKYGGISKYFCALMNNIISGQEIDVLLPIKYTNNHHLLQNFPQFKLLPASNNKTSSSPDNRAHSDMLQKQFEKELQIISAQNYDLVHPTYYYPYFLKLIGELPFVLTIHDMIYEIYSEQFIGGPPIAQYKAALAHAASHIIAVSDHTKQDIIRILNIDPDKITVIHHGVDQVDDIQNISNIALPSQYMLYVGERTAPYKNFYFFLEALLPLFQDFPNLYVICTGSPFSTNELETFNHSGIANRMIHRFVKETDMPLLYKNALAFIYPSLYEGFGLPILEAFSASCPVILSRSSCFPEIARDAALYFDTKYAADLTNKMKEIIKDKNLRYMLIEKGEKRSANFSWERTTLDTISVYKKILTS